MPADDQLIGRLEESFRRMTGHEDDLAERFYRRLFDQRPDLRAMFPVDMTGQRQKLLDSLRMVIENLRTPEKARTQLEELGRSHVRYGVRPEHYRTVCEILVTAMAEQVGADWSGELQDDWSSAIRLVSEIMLEGAKSAPLG